MANLLEPRTAVPTDAGSITLPPTPGGVNLLAPNPAQQPNLADLYTNPLGRPLSDMEWYQQTYGQPFTGHPDQLFTLRTTEDPEGAYSFMRWAQTAPPDQVQPLLYQPGMTDLPPGDPRRQLEVGVQGVGRGMADFAGAPVDILTLLSNVLNAGLEKVGGVFGWDFDLGRAHDLPLSSNSIANTASQVAESLGIRVRDPYTEMTPEERLYYNIDRFGTQAALAAAGLTTAAGSPSVNPMLNPAATPNRVVEAFTRPYWETPARAAIGDVAAGAGAGTANYAYQEFVSPEFRQANPVLDAVLNTAADIAGGVGGYTMAGTARTAGSAAGNAARNVFLGATERTLPSGAAFPRNPETGQPYARSVVDMAARTAQQVASSPTMAADEIRRAATDLLLGGAGRNALPTTGILSNDVGLTIFENAARRQNPEPFISRDLNVRDAAVEAAGGIAPQAATGRQFTGAVDNIINQQQLLADSLAQQFRPAAGQGSQAAADIHNLAADKLTRMREASAARFAAVDPNRTATIDVTPLQDLANQIVGQVGNLADPAKILPRGLLDRINNIVGTPETRMPVEGEMTVPRTDLGTPREAADGAGGFTPETNRPVLDPNNPYPQGQETIPVNAEAINPATPPTTTVGEIVQIWPELSKAIDRARRAENFKLGDNLQALRTRMNELIAEAAANGDVEAQRALEAQQNWRDTLGTTFGEGAAQQFRRDFNYNPDIMLSERTAGKFLRPGAPELAKQLDRIVGAEGSDAIHRYLVADMAQNGVIDKNGMLNPDRLRQWQERWSSVIEIASPRTAKEIQTTLAQLDASGRVGPDALQSDILAARRSAANPVDNPGDLGLVLGRNPTNAVQAIFRSGDPERAVEKILAQIGDDQQALDGLRAAVREYMRDMTTTSRVASTASGVNPISFAALDDMFKRYESTLARIFTPEQMNALQQAHSLLRPLQNLTQSATTGSQTAERFANDFWRYLEIGFKARFGMLKGGGIIRTLKLAAQTFPSPGAAVHQLLMQMWFDPELAAHLLTRPVAEVTTPGWNKRLSQLIGFAAGSRSLQDDTAEQ